MTKKIDDNDLSEVSGGRMLHRVPRAGGGAIGRGPIGNSEPTPVEDEPGGGSDSIPPDTEGGGTGGGNSSPF